MRLPSPVLGGLGLGLAPMLRDPVATDDDSKDHEDVLFAAARRAGVGMPANEAGPDTDGSSRP